MKIAVLSGKGGTGKTSVAAALLRVWERPCVAVDLDVEAPNLHLLLDPSISSENTSGLTVPRVAHPERCTGCNACTDLCAFKAVLNFGDFTVVFADMCHGCEGCFWVCNEDVFTKDTRDLGLVKWGVSSLPIHDVPFVMGQLRIGEPMSPPLMRDVIRQVDMHFPDVVDGTRDVIMDAPPGASCPAMTVVQAADVLLLVAEPTPFGLHDLEIAWRASCQDGKPVGVVLNRAGGAGPEGDEAIARWSRKQGLPILGSLPFSREVAEAYAHKNSIETVSQDYLCRVKKLAEKVQRLCLEGVAI